MRAGSLNVGTMELPVMDVMKEEKKMIDATEEDAGDRMSSCGDP